MRHVSKQVWYNVMQYDMVSSMYHWYRTPCHICHSARRQDIAVLCKVLVPAPPYYDTRDGSCSKKSLSRSRGTNSSLD